jgi:hypothetical protein
MPSITPRVGGCAICRSGSSTCFEAGGTPLLSVPSREWDAYIDDFATKIPNSMDILFCNCVGWPGIHSPPVKDWIVSHQLTADAWYVASPNLSVAETKRLEKVGKAVDDLLDKIGN